MEFEESLHNLLKSHNDQLTNLLEITKSLETIVKSLFSEQNRLRQRIERLENGVYE